MDKGGKSIGKLLINLIPAIVISFIIQLLLHEIGHFIGGAFTGWRFLFIQIYRLIIKRTDNKLRITMVNDIGFQCIMYPKSINAKASFYTMGGCVINLIAGMTGLIIIIIAPMSSVLWLYVWCFTVFGIGMFIMNGAASTKRVCNDKACYKLLKTDSHTKLCHNAQLLVAKDLMQGLTYRQIEKETICLCPEVAKNDIEAYQAVLECYYYLDMGNYAKMGQALEKIKVTENISKEILESIELEKNYLQLLYAYGHNDSPCNDNAISRIRESIEKHSKKRNIHSLRVKVAYEAYWQFKAEDKDKASEILNNAVKVMEQLSCVYEGEKIFCIRQLKCIKRIIKDFLYEKNSMAKIIQRKRNPSKIIE